MEATGPVKAEGGVHISRPSGQDPGSKGGGVGEGSAGGQQGDGHKQGHVQEGGRGGAAAVCGMQQQGGRGERDGGVYAGQQVRLSEVERARGAAKQLLGRQRGNLVLWGALAELEMLVGNVKVNAQG